VGAGVGAAVGGALDGGADDGGALEGGADDGGADDGGGDGCAIGLFVIVGPTSKPMLGSGANSSLGGAPLARGLGGAELVKSANVRPDGDGEGSTTLTGALEMRVGVARPSERRLPSGAPRTAMALPMRSPGFTFPVLTLLKLTLSPAVAVAVRVKSPSPVP
jgi:hypothetical protein